MHHKGCDDNRRVDGMCSHVVPCTEVSEVEVEAEIGIHIDVKVRPAVEIILGALHCLYCIPVF